jgi:hypothetical protein
LVDRCPTGGFVARGQQHPERHQTAIFTGSSALPQRLYLRKRLNSLALLLAGRIGLVEGHIRAEPKALFRCRIQSGGRRSRCLLMAKGSCLTRAACC